MIKISRRVQFISQLNLPKLEFLQFGNIYSANVDEFNFKFVPKLESSGVEVFAWWGLNCLDATIDKKSTTFDLTEEGLVKAKSWLLAELEKSM